MAECFPSLHFRVKLAEQKINRLVVTRSDDHNNIQESSPSLGDMQNETSRVKKLSRLFEEKLNTNSSQTNWWLEEKINLPTKCPSSPKNQNRISGSINFSSSAKPPGSKLERIVHELMQKELTYIRALERGLKNYVTIIKHGGYEVPQILRHETFKLFGNIEEIYKLHKHLVYPQLIQCEGNARLIADVISSLIHNDFFYCYIVYGINQRSADQWILYHHKFFDGLRSASDDLLGINSFIIQPIQKLPRYKMLFDEMIKELSHNIPSNKETVAACCVAEKNVQRILFRLNEALSITDIIETHELKIFDQMSMLTSMQKDFGVDVNVPIMLLVPKTSSYFPFRPPFNIYDLGKILKTSEFKVQECSSNRSFASKVFLFEKCLLYTKIMSESTLGYRNHFLFASRYAFITNDSLRSFRICGDSKKYDVIFSSDNIERIASMKKLINQFYDQRRSADSAFIDGSENMICDYQQTSTDEEDDDWMVVENEPNLKTFGEKEKI